MVPRNKWKVGRGPVGKALSYWKYGWRYWLSGISWDVAWGTAHNFVYGFRKYDKD